MSDNPLSWWYALSPQSQDNPLASWRYANNPVGTETTQSMGAATPIDPIVAWGSDGQPITASQTAAARQQIQQAYQTAPTVALGMMGTTSPEGGGIKAFHGSPHDFDVFDASKIGTGEGAQAYGHGLYFAGNENVAQMYRDKLSTGQQFYHAGERLTGSDEIAAGLIQQAGGDKATAQKNAADMFGDLSKNPYTKGLSESFDKLDPEKITAKAPPGRMYEVNIAADPQHFLDWDKPLSEQSPQVQQALVNAGYDLSHNPATAAYGRERTGGEFVKANKPEEVSADMQKAGIPGIKYKDAGSRNVQLLSPNETVHGQWLVKQIPNGNVLYRGPDEAAAREAYAKGQTHNYVVFDPRIINVVRKYAVPAFASSSAIPAAMGGSDQPPEAQ